MRVFCFQGKAELAQVFTRKQKTQAFRACGLTICNIEFNGSPRSGNPLNKWQIPNDKSSELAWANQQMKKNCADSAGLSTLMLRSGQVCNIGLNGSRRRRNPVFVKFQMANDKFQESEACLSLSPNTKINLAVSAVYLQIIKLNCDYVRIMIFMRRNPTLEVFPALRISSWHRVLNKYSECENLWLM